MKNLLKNIENSYNNYKEISEEKISSFQRQQKVLQNIKEA